MKAQSGRAEREPSYDGEVDSTTAEKKKKKWKVYIYAKTQLELKGKEREREMDGVGWMKKTVRRNESRRDWM